MRRLSLLPLLLLLALAACQTADRGPQTASPTATPTITQSPNPTITQSPTPAPPTLSELGLSPDLQQTLESRQGWTFRWDATRGLYTITQKEWNANQNTFKTNTHGEIGYIDAEGLLHLHSTSFTAVPAENSAFQASQTDAEITLDLKSLPDVATATATPAPENQNNAVETQLGPFTLIDTKNPLFEKTGILKFTAPDGTTYIYSAASALTSEKTIDGKKVKVAEFAALEKNDQGVMAFPLDTLHSGFPVAWLIAQGFDKPFPQSLVESFKAPGYYTKSVGYTIHFEYLTSDTPNDLSDDKKFAVLSPPVHQNPENFKLPVLDESGQFIWFFVTDEKTGESFFTVPLQLLNPLDPQNPHPDETMFVFGTPGTMTPEQYSLFKQDYIDNGKFQANYLLPGAPSIFLAQEGGYFTPSGKTIWSDYFTPSLDSLLKREGESRISDPNNRYLELGSAIGFNITKKFDKLGPEKTVIEIVISDDPVMVEELEKYQTKLFGLGF